MFFRNIFGGFASVFRDLLCKMMSFLVQCVVFMQRMDVMSSVVLRF